MTADTMDSGPVTADTMDSGPVTADTMDSDAVTIVTMDSDPVTIATMDSDPVTIATMDSDPVTIATMDSTPGRRRARDGFCRSFESPRCRSRLRVHSRHETAAHAEDPTTTLVKDGLTAGGTETQR